MEYFTHTLPNGIRLVHKHVNSPVAHCGIIIGAGSRNELSHEHGLAHFIEHMLFKGTKKRKAYHILSRMEDVGGEINAYTTKEETCIHTSFFNNYYNRALELFNDLIFNSVFPEKEIEKEKEVVLDEINSYKDSPSELIYDEFEELLFKELSLGRNILGNIESVKAINKQKIIDFIQRNYLTNQIVISSVGEISFDTVCNLFEKYFSVYASLPAIKPNKQSSEFAVFKKTEHKNTHQVHCIIGNKAYTIKDEKRYPLFLLNNILGGPGFNSRLNLSLRERKGLAYNVDSTYTPYSDTGSITIYFGTDKKNLNKSLKTILKEIEIIRSYPLGKNQLMKAKKQLIGQIAISSENFENQMISNGKSLLLFDEIISLDIIKKNIENITAEDVISVANEIFQPDQLSQLVYI